MYIVLIIPIILIIHMILIIPIVPDPYKPDGQMEADWKTPSGRQMGLSSGQPDGKMAIGLFFVGIGPSGPYGPDGLKVPSQLQATRFGARMVSQISRARESTQSVFLSLISPR